MVHSKVMIVDDRLLRIGSANLNNRSMGTDTECDLAIEAQSADRARGDRRRCATRLLADHCGVCRAGGRGGDPAPARLLQPPPTR